MGRAPDEGKAFGPLTFRTGCPFSARIIILCEKIKYAKTAMVT